MDTIPISANTGKTHGVVRSPKWNAVRKKFLAAHPTCAVCGGKTKVEVHHIIPFSIDPSKELDEKNLISLCEGRQHLTCHLIIGHGGDYRDYNPAARKSARFMYWLLKYRQKPKLA